jgi:transposase
VERVLDPGFNSRRAQNKSPEFEQNPKNWTQKESTSCDNSTGGVFVMSGQKGMTHYRKEIKEQAVEMFLKEGMDYRDIAQRLGIRKAARIEKWVQRYRREGAAAFEKVIGRPRKGTQTELERLRMENDLLKKFQAELRKLELEKRNIG